MNAVLNTAKKRSQEGQKVLESGHEFCFERPGSKHEKGNRTDLENWFRGQLLEQSRPVVLFFS